MNDVKDGLVSKFKVHIVSNSYCKSKLGTLTDRTEVLYQFFHDFISQAFAWMKRLSDSSLPACATTHREGARCCKSEGETVPD